MDHVKLDTKAALLALHDIHMAVELCRDGRGLTPDGTGEARVLVEKLREIVRQVARDGHVEIVGPIISDMSRSDGNNCCLDCGVAHQAGVTHREGCLALDIVGR